ncbi:MAG: hypothetical protein AAF211_30070 [Myxococcota bacterium]
MLGLSLAFLAVLVVSEADAGVYVGNPGSKLRLTLDRGPDDLVAGGGTVSSVRIWYCGGGYADYTVNDIVQPWEPDLDVTIDGGHLCSATVSFSGTVSIDGDGAFGPFTVESTETSVVVPLSGATQSAPFASYSVVSGTMSPGAPRVRIDL